MYNKAAVLVSLLFVLPSLAAPVPDAAPLPEAFIQRDTVAPLPKARRVSWAISGRSAAPQDNESESWGGEASKFHVLRVPPLMLLQVKRSAQDNESESWGGEWCLEETSLPETDGA